MDNHPSVGVVEYCGSNNGGSLFRCSDHEMRSDLDDFTTACLLVDSMLVSDEEKEEEESDTNWKQLEKLIAVDASQFLPSAFMQSKLTIPFNSHRTIQIWFTKRSVNSG